MLDAIKKKFFNSSKEVVMEDPKEQPEMSVAPTAELSEMVAKMALQTESFAKMQEQLATLTTQYAEAQAALKASDDAQAALVAATLLKRDEQRSAQLTALIGTEKAPAVLAKFSALDDATFETFMGAMAASYEKESESAMFKEIGVSAEAAVVEEKPVHFNTFIKK